MSSEVIDSEDDRLPDEAHLEDLVKELPQASDKMNVIMDQVLSTLPKRYFIGKRLKHKIFN